MSRGNSKIVEFNKHFSSEFTTNFSILVLIGNAMIQSARHSRESSVCRGKKKRIKEKRLFMQKFVKSMINQKNDFYKSLLLRIKYRLNIEYFIRLMNLQLISRKKW